MPQDLESLAVRIGWHSWASAQMFELEGSWSTDEVDSAATVHLARFSRYHGWHAELWTELLPDSAGLAEAAGAGPPDRAWADQFGGAAALGDTAARLAVLTRVFLPRLQTATTCLLDLLAGPGDVAVARSGRFVAADLAAELVDGHRLMHQLISGEALAQALATAGEIDVALSLSEFGRCGA